MVRDRESYCVLCLSEAAKGSKLLCRWTVWKAETIRDERAKCCSPAEEEQGVDG